MADFCARREKEILDLIFQHFGKENFKPDLSRAARILEPHLSPVKAQNPFVITVAGTNGKGETCLGLSHIMAQNKINYALFTSPHLVSIRERFEFNGEKASYEELWPLMQNLAQNLDPDISFYEFVYAVFLILCQQKRPEVIIQEVGMGGRLDAVSLLPADVCGLTSISRDHQEFLGNSYHSILKEKLGVVPLEGTLISNLELAYLRQLTRRYCGERGIKWRDIFCPGTTYTERNQQLAIAIAGLCPLVSCSEISLPSKREEVTSRGNRFIVIGAHNLDGVRKVFKQDHKVQRILMGLPKRDEKTLHNLLSSALRLWCQTPIELVYFEHPKGMSFSAWSAFRESYLNDKRVIFWDSIEACMKGSHDKAQATLVTGSNYFLGEFKLFLGDSSRSSSSHSGS